MIGSKISPSILIFISPIDMKILGSAPRWHFDGTFKTCPTHFHQILSIHCLYQKRMFPAAYIMFQKKERETYIKAFISVKEILVSNNYTLNVTDFELALIQAISITLKMTIFTDFERVPYPLDLLKLDKNGCP
ncbi:hypothetical protein BpHYR1_007115 [Brachionus plicatilis]|uniref:MULE transposase domain-containing protein n=1 Tax=Brachionus plicatilis TaxID=10195 RepID=A0A3M7RET8_BRAPC|nr:hypothetical protein BpHYR1_007115 [Brachionus plicatilis]